MVMFELKDFDFYQARYIVLKELDLRGPIGEILMKRYHTLLNMVGFVVNNIESSMNPERGLAGTEVLGLETLELVEQVTRDLPTLMLTTDGVHNWSDFVGAWLTLMDNTLTLNMQLVETIEGPNIEETKHMYYEVFDNLRFAIGATVRLVDLGASFQDLLVTSKELLQEMKTWQHARPVSLQLSEAYLKTLKFDE